MTLFTLSPMLLRGLACAVWLAVLITLAIRRPAWRMSPKGMRLMLAGLAVIGAGFLIGAALTMIRRTELSADRIAIETVGLIAGGFVLAGLLRYRPAPSRLEGPVHAELAQPERAPGSALPPALEDEGRRTVDGVVDRAVAGVMVAALDEGAAGSGPVVYANPAAQPWLQPVMEEGDPATLAGLFIASGRGGLWPMVAKVLAQGRPVCEMLSLREGASDQAMPGRLTLVPSRRAEGVASDGADANAPDLVLAVLERGSEAMDGTLEHFQSESEAAMTRLAAGLAHDFSNVLTVILTASEILLMEQDLPEALRRRIERMNGAAQRGANLTEQLRAFAGRLDLMEERVNLHALLRDSAVEFKTTLGPDIELHYDLTNDECPVMLDAARMRAALKTVLNYCRAMLPEGGRVELSTRFAAMSRQEGAPPDEVVLTIARSGSRLQMADARKLLEQPYSIGNSSVAGGGFGLSLVAGFVRQSGGRAQFTNEIGRGPILEIELPLAVSSPEDEEDEAAGEAGQGPAALSWPAAPAVPPPAPAFAANAPSQPLHVLVVDDDDLMREAASAELASLGCTVTLAVTAPEALAWLGEDASIQAVLADFTLDGDRDGQWLARQVRERSPAMRFVLMSGDLTRAQDSEDGHTVFLPKPFSRAQLAASLGLPPRVA